MKIKYYILIIITFILKCNNVFSFELDTVWKSNLFGNYFLFQNPNNNNLLFDSNGKLIELNSEDGSIVREFPFYNFEIEISPNTEFISNNETINSKKTINIYNYNTLEIFHTIENANLCKFIDDENIIYKIDNENLDSTNFVIYNLKTKEKKELKTFYDITAIGVSKVSNKIVFAHKDRKGKINVAISIWDLNNLSEIKILDEWDMGYIFSSYIGKIEFSQNGNYFGITGTVVFGNIYYFDGMVYDVKTLKNHQQYSLSNKDNSQKFGGFLNDSIAYVTNLNNFKDKYSTNFISIKEKKILLTFDKGLFNCIYNENENKIYAKVAENTSDLDATYTACYQLTYPLSIDNLNENANVTYVNKNIIIKNIDLMNNKISICTMDGNVIFSQIILNDITEINIPINLANGLYIVYLTDGKNHKKVHKLLVIE